MNTTTPTITFFILALGSMLAFSGCQKPSNEEVAAQVKAALAEEKAKEQAAAPAPPPAPAAEASSPKPAPRIRHGAQTKPVPVEQAAPVEKIVCANCGVVLSVKETEQEGKGSGLGVVAGGVAGGLLGNQVGQGTGRDLATIAGVVGGAVAGNKIEKTMRKTKVYDVTVRMENGEERILRYATAPGVVAGDKVKVEGEQLVRQ